MADYKASNAPFINTTFYVTSQFGSYPDGGTHVGFDIATPAPGSNLYSMVDGTIVAKAFNSGGYGNYIIIKANNGLGFLYAHMSEPSNLNIGDTISKNNLVGHEGTTGNSTGVHLHLEMQDLSNSNWQFNAPLSKYLNPADFLGIPNKLGISAIYDNTTPPKPPKIKSKYKTPYFPKIRFNIIR